MHLLDFAVFKPDEECRQYDVEEVTGKFKAWGDSYGISRSEPIEFLRKFFPTTGIRYMYTPKNVVPKNPPEGLRLGFNEAMAEARLCMFGAISQLLDKSGVSAQEVDIVVTACGNFCPIPSLASMVVNEFNMNEDVLSYHLGGMACSTGATGVNLIRDLLKANPNSTALFVTHENITTGFYRGDRLEMALSNVLFGMGASATLFTNKPALVKRAKYQLLHSVRVHKGSEDWVYRSMGMFEEDAWGEARPRFSPDVPKAAQKAIQAVMKKVAPKILTWYQLGAAARNYAVRSIWGKEAEEPYAPSFAECIDHFLLHPGTHGMLKGFSKGLKLPVESVLPSAAALRDYGNLSSSSTYYVLAYVESIIGVKKGETLMQLGVGTGVKAGVNIWRAVRDVKETHEAWRHLEGVAITEADLVLPLVGSGKEDIAVAERAYESIKQQQVDAGLAADGPLKKTLDPEEEDSPVAAAH